jgi:cytochrome o ubiquinol oxidase subunit 2
VSKLRHLFFILLSLGSTLLLSGCDMALLNPQGLIATQEKQLLIVAVLLMCVIVIPVLILTFIVAWKFRASNTKAKYAPDWGHSTILEVVWWSIPCVIIIILAAITMVSTHKLDPYKPLEHKEKPITIQVIALNWRWLFIYPEQNIATINFVQFPVNKPVQFLITSDAPMNSFQIPQLAGQIYAMAGMQTKLNLITDKVGDYKGFSANFSGLGFSGMRFVARASSSADFDKWVKTVKQAPVKLTQATYDKLVPDSEDTKVQYFATAEKDLLDNVMMKYMMPMDNGQMNHNMEHGHTEKSSK